MNELRDAIARRDAGGVLEAMTRQRATFTGKELERALQKEIYAQRGASDAEKRGVELARAQFADKVLDHAEAVHLSDERGGPTTRYTTRKVLEGEGYVWRAAEGLAANRTHGLSDAQRFATLNSARHDGISREQARAFAHAAGPEGLAIIDGLAGAGKSRTTNAVRDAYEAAGHRVIGLAWTHKVVHAMEENGFENTSTVKRELFMLANGRQQWDSKTVVDRRRGGDARHRAHGDGDRLRAGSRREIDPRRRRPPAPSNRARRHVRRAERPLWCCDPDRDSAAGFRRRPAGERVFRRRAIPQGARHL